MPPPLIFIVSSQQKLRWFISKILIKMLIPFVLPSRSTPLHHSAGNGRLEVCRLLVESKCDVSLRSRDMFHLAAAGKPPSHSALQLAIDNSRADVAAYLRSIGAPQ